MLVFALTVTLALGCDDEITSIGFLAEDVLVLVEDFSVVVDAVLVLPVGMVDLITGSLLVADSVASLLVGVNFVLAPKGGLLTDLVADLLMVDDFMLVLTGVGID